MRRYFLRVLWPLYACQMSPKMGRMSERAGGNRMENESEKMNKIKTPLINQLILKFAAEPWENDLNFEAWMGKTG